METNRIFIKDFTKTTEHPDLDLLLTVKSFNLQEIRARYVASLSSKTGRRGSSGRREVALGGVVSASLRAGEMLDQDVLVKMKEPRGIHLKEDRVALAAEGDVYLYDERGGVHFTDPWLSYIHSLEFSPWDKDRMLVCSSGLEMLIEFDLNTLKADWRWSAWEHGFAEGADPETGEKLYITRDTDEAERLKSEGKNVKFISDPATDVLPTAMRAAFINSTSYDLNDQDYVLGTFFHEGALYKIDCATGNPQRIFTGFSKPHGGRNFTGDTYMITSTGSGEVVLKSGEEETIYDFTGLENKPEELGEMEWLQNSIVHGDWIITIDSNRTSFVLFNPVTKVYSMIPYDPDWAVQDMVVGRVADDCSRWLKSL